MASASVSARRSTPASTPGCSAISAAISVPVTVLSLSSLDSSGWVCLTAAGAVCCGRRCAVSPCAGPGRGAAVMGREGARPVRRGQGGGGGGEVAGQAGPGQVGGGGQGAVDHGVGSQRADPD